MPFHSRPKDRNVQIITRRQIIKEIASKLGIYEESIDEVYSAFESVLIEHLLESNAQYDTDIRLTAGICLYSDFVPEHMHRHPTSKEPILIKDKLKFGCKFSVRFKDEKTAEYRHASKLWNEWQKNKDKKDDNE